MRGVASFLAILSDRDDPWLCGYLEDMFYAFAASNFNIGAKSADICATSGQLNIANPRGGIKPITKTAN